MLAKKLGMKDFFLKGFFPPCERKNTVCTQLFVLIFLFYLTLQENKKRPKKKKKKKIAKCKISQREEVMGCVPT